MTLNGKAEEKRRAEEKKKINVALQGGGSHGAFSWGVLDRLLEDGRLEIAAVSGTSAGAMNAVALADGFVRGGADGARRKLDDFWRAVARKAPVGMIHFDAHSDTNDRYFGDNPYTHGTPFRRAIEEGLLDPRRVVQIGIRGSVYEPGEHAWAVAQGIRIIYMEEFVRRGAMAVMQEARTLVGDSPTYVTFDIDCIDPSMAPGTGTPELGGFTTREAQEMVRLLDGLNFAGADVVEVAPPFDLGGMTALAGATMMFELLCVMAKSVADRRARG